EADVAKRGHLELAAIGGIAGDILAAEIFRRWTQTDIAEGEIGGQILSQTVADPAVSRLEQVHALNLLRRECVLLTGAETVEGRLVGNQGALVGRDRKRDAPRADGSIAESPAKQLRVGRVIRQRRGDVGGMVGGEIERACGLQL